MDDDPTTPLEARAASIDYGRRRILQGATLALERGMVTALVGPNGCGKSTLLRTLARLARPSSGAVLLDGRDIHGAPTRDVAKRLAILPQGRDSPAGLTVRDLVAHGRYPHMGLLRRPNAQDADAVARALEATAMTPLADREVDTLSGGERQRAWIAMALAQETDILLLDEPTTYLDIRYQLEVLTLVRRLNREHGITVLWVLHDLNQAAEHSDRIVVMRDGRILADGAPRDVLTPATIREAFDVHVLVNPHPLTGAPLCLPIAAPVAAPLAQSVHIPVPVQVD